MQAIVDYFVEKIVGGLRRELVVKMYDDRLFDAENFKIREPLIERLEQRRCRLGIQYGARMRIECDRRGMCADSLCTFNDCLHYLLMTEMQAIENAQRQDRRAKDIRVLDAVEYLHSEPVSNLPLRG